MKKGDPDARQRYLKYRQELYKSSIEVRNHKKHRSHLGALGEPGRFYVPSNGMHRGVRHFES